MYTKIMTHPYLELAVRWLLGLTFMYASCHKIADPAHFAKIIYGYKLFPAFSINLIAILVPFFELICGVALVLGIFPRSAMLLINLLLLGFIISLSINLVRGHEFDCGCFSFTKEATFSPQLLLLRDIFYLGCGVFIVRFRNSRKWCLRKSYL